VEPEIDKFAGYFRIHRHRYAKRCGSIRVWGY
jgi:hypothetical protein